MYPMENILDQDELDAAYAEYLERHPECDILIDITDPMFEGAV